ncbi:hypothetical protein SEPCBS57363_001796 [Sporothrix epigloea]|uniref:Alpha/beta hydrolase fold-3 domain-containing protein n=1 Tax=Sporothrix epigloea TaxID=1892477 RepID=A0ABP0DCA4_9PEZI
MNLRPPPDYLLRQNFPIAVIRYRWTPGREDEDIKRDWQVDQDPSQRQEAQSSHLWPRPLHDVTFAYGWIKRHLSPSLSDSTRSVDGRGHFLHRDIYVYGAYLGASLATSLALTETHPSQRVAIRGVATYNGIYNWTAFVGVKDDCIPIVVDVKTVQKDTPGIQALPLLFRQPSDLFDDFASPCLFFRTTGHLVAPLDLDPNISQRLLEENEARLEEEEERENRKTSQAFGKRTFSIESLGTSRKVYLGFPPVRSTLCLPSALLLHTSAPPDVSTKPTRERKRGVTSIPRRKIPESSNGKNSFAIQAEEMTALMRRSIDLIEVKRVKDQQPALMPENVDHRTGDYDAAILSNKSKRRVRIVGVDGPRDGSLELGIDGQKKLLAWLREHMLQNQE